MRNEIRPPEITRVSRSRPSWSVPSGCASDGGHRTCAKSTSLGSPTNSGATSEAASNRTRTTRPAAAVLRRRRRAQTERPTEGVWAPSFITNARVDVDIQQVGHQIDQHEHCGKDDHNTLDDRI